MVILRPEKGGWRDFVIFLSNITLDWATKRDSTGDECEDCEDLKYKFFPAPNNLKAAPEIPQPIAWSINLTLSPTNRFNSDFDLPDDISPEFELI